MNWDWKFFFSNIDDIDLFLDSINHHKSYAQKKKSISSIISTDEKKIENQYYHKRSGVFFTLKTHDKSISIDKTFLLFFIEDFKKEQEFHTLYKGKNYLYFDFEFSLELTLSRDTLSGLNKYNELLRELIKGVKNTSISIQGSKLLNNESELEEFLKKKFHFFTTLNEELTFN